MNYSDLATRLTDVLALQNPPMAIRFADSVPDDVPAYSANVPAPTEDGRTGPVAASCVYWMKGTENTFSTVEADHGNCSVGGVTHGFKSLDQVGNNQDVAALVQSGWVAPEVFPHIPAVKDKPASIVYGPLAETNTDPDVVFLRLNAKQAMVISDAIPDMQVEGKPQCHIIAIAKDQQKVAASIGCMLSRVRTGMLNTEMTCAIPGARLQEVVESIESAMSIDKTVAAYASEDAARFSA